MERKYIIEDYPSGGLYIKGGTGACIIMSKHDYDFSTMDRDDFLALRSQLKAVPDILEALEHAPIVSQYNNAEDFITAFETWRDKYKLPAIAKALGKKDGVQ